MKGITTEMKKISLVLIIILTLLALIACGNGNGPDGPPAGNGPTVNNPDENGEPDPDEPEPPSTDDPAILDAFFFKMGDVLIHMDENIDIVIEQIGEPLGRFEAESCAFEGIDIIFSYPGIQIYTYPAGDNNFIHTIGFFDDSVRTAEGGIHLGSNIQAVIDVYGNDYGYETGMYRYTRGLTVLEFLVDDNEMVIGITYRLLLDL